ncbi:hypothetical protein Pcinc_037158 [Petrolisthes cinctipes]|uniref:Glutathione peroxidase n=1 Tax=Petrolisthes cinctipes TaxID=88211 RepID=A0AAE1BTB2_PETCI|nr:hypothetical protein Pcinc_037158 [Petrolisthes cinctipes]
MLWAGLVTLAAVGVAGQEYKSSRACYHHPSAGGTIYDFQETDVYEAKNISLADYRGKYRQLNELQASYSNLTVLAFPCNQFAKQEPAATATELMNGLKHVRPGGGFEPNFTFFRKIDVNGESAHPLFTYLKAYCPATRETFSDPDYLYYSPIQSNDIRWNWEKFLVTKSGKPYMRYDPHTEPEQIRKDIIFLLQQSE